MHVPPRQRPEAVGGRPGRDTRPFINTINATISSLVSLPGSIFRAMGGGQQRRIGRALEGIPFRVKLVRFIQRSLSLAFVRYFRATDERKMYITYNSILIINLSQVRLRKKKKPAALLGVSGVYRKLEKASTRYRPKEGVGAKIKTLNCCPLSLSLPYQFSLTVRGWASLITEEAILDGKVLSWLLGVPFIDHYSCVWKDEAPG